MAALFGLSGQSGSDSALAIACAAVAEQPRSCLAELCFLAHKPLTEGASFLVRFCSCLEQVHLLDRVQIVSLSFRCLMVKNI